MIKTAVAKVIVFYRNYLSQFKLPSCRYFPTCSQYAQDAVEKYGVLRGLLKSIYRILRCNPFARGGYDPVD